MKYSFTQTGRTAVLRLEHGEILHKIVEEFAERENISRAVLSYVGGVDKGSTLVVGPEDPEAKDIKPMQQELDSAYEAVGNGTIFPDEETGRPMLHMHLACGRKTGTITGCVRPGVKIWLIGEVVIQEITGTDAVRGISPISGFKLLHIE